MCLEVFTMCFFHARHESLKSSKVYRDLLICVAFNKLAFGHTFSLESLLTAFCHASARP